MKPESKTTPFFSDMSKQAIKRFIEMVEHRAETKMIITGKLEGSHYAAMKELQKEIGAL
jgi:hypothetical protein